MTSILVTGGAGFIGSHMCAELLDTGHTITVFDNLCNSSERSVRAVEQITQRQVLFVHGDLRNQEQVSTLFKRNEFDAVMHFAGLKAVSESVADPIFYYENNVVGTLNLLSAMNEAGTKTLVFSSSATVYGHPASMPIAETCATRPINPYGQSKLMVEQILSDLCASDAEWRVSALRYFNPVGAHQSGEIGEDPNDTPNNLMPYIAQVAIGRRPELLVFGDDYDTPDGTGVRDYIHVMDLVRGHLKALELLKHRSGFHVHNLGTGRGYSVLEVIDAFSRACNRKVPYRIVARRPGDAASSFADPGLANDELGWEARYSLDDMCRDAWNWQRKYPQGFNE